MWHSQDKDTVSARKKVLGLVHLHGMSMQHLKVVFSKNCAVFTGNQQLLQNYSVLVDVSRWSGFYWNPEVPLQSIQKELHVTCQSLVVVFPINLGGPSFLLNC